MKGLARMCRGKMKASTRMKVSNRQMKKCHNKKLHKTSNKAPHNKPTPHKNCPPSSPWTTSPPTPSTTCAPGKNSPNVCQLSNKTTETPNNPNSNSTPADPSVSLKSTDARSSLIIPSLSKGLKEVLTELRMRTKMILRTVEGLWKPWLRLWTISIRRLSMLIIWGRKI